MQFVVTNPIVEGITIRILIGPAIGLGFALVINIAAFVLDQSIH
jgi:RsiW-degrading membrane proteinase PrsW (M82 family)